MSILDNKKILITSALPYVNNVPHLGNIIGCVLSADVFSRYCKMREYDSIYICGTDEYGTATEIKAFEEKITPKQVCDKYYKIHKDIYEWFGIEFDIFGRTSTEKHTKITHDIFNALYKNGHVVEEEVEQFYDEIAKMFLADRYIEGTCPYCKYEGARSDQCDKCGRLLQHGELKDPISKVTKTTPILKKTKHLFIDLPGIEKKLDEWITTTSKEGAWSENSINIAKSWIREGLKKRAITRDLKWGVPVPLEGWEDKVFYVWFDAPIGYISITANLTDDWEKWWKNPEQVELYQFMGKDNVPFHTVIFPATMIGTGMPWTMLHHINTTEFLNYEDGKFSKSRHVGVFGDDAMNSGIPSDVWRYYLLSNRPEKADTTFLWEDFTDKSNNELLANLGNLVNRTLVFIDRNFNGDVPIQTSDEDDKKFTDMQKKLIQEITYELEAVKIKDALHKVMAFSRNANKYFQDSKPWEKIKTDEKRAGTIMAILANQIKDLAILTQPFLPATSIEITKQMNLGPTNWNNLGKEIGSGHKIGKPSPIFRKLEPKEINELRTQFTGSSKGKKTQDETKQQITISDLDLEVGEILSVEKHPDAEKLFVEKVKLSDGERQIVSGLVGHYNEEELVGKKVVIVKNLASAKLRGIESQGMLLAAEGKEREPMHDGKAAFEQGALEAIFCAKSNVGDKIAIVAKGNKTQTDVPKKTITIKQFEKITIEVKNFDVVSEGSQLETQSGEKLRMKNIKEGIVR